MEWLFGSSSTSTVKKKEKDDDIQGPAPVTLHVYDLGSGTAVLNGVLNAVGSGAYHTGVEVYGWEYSFGCIGDGPDQTGVFAIKPKSCDQHSYRESIAMGDTMSSKRQVSRLIDKLSKQWPGRSYDLLRHNCTHFSNELCLQLGVNGVPSWIMSLAGVGAMLRSGARLVGATPQIVGEGIMAAPAFLAGAVNLLGGGEDNGRSGGQIVSLNVGDAVEVFTNSQGVWCPGRVTDIVRSETEAPRAEVLFQVPGSDQGAMATKVLPFSHKDLRLAQVSQPPSFPQPSSPLLPQDKDAENPQRIVEGDSVEVYSNSNSQWCKGHVEAVKGKMVSTAFLAPGARPGEYSRKTLPMDHKDLRRLDSKNGYLAQPPANGYVAQAPATKVLKERRSSKEVWEAMDSAPGGFDGGFVVGTWVEVFSSSTKHWCVGRITQVTDNDVNVVFQLPGASLDEFVEKRVPRGSKDIRIAGTKGKDEPRPTPAWSSKEKVAYAREFMNVAKTSEVSPEQLASSEKVLEFLKTSGLPIKVLKDILHVANPQDLAMIGLSKFSIACRLTGHCQCVLADGDSATADVMMQELHHLLDGEFYRQPPAVLPKFGGVGASTSVRSNITEK